MYRFVSTRPSGLMICSSPPRPTAAVERGRACPPLKIALPRAPRQTPPPQPISPAWASVRPPGRASPPLLARRAALDHEDGVVGAGDDHIEVGFVELRDRGIRHELSVDEPDAHRSDGSVEGDLRDRQCRGRRVDREDVRVVLLVRRKGRNDDLDVVAETLGEERAQWTVHQAAGEDAVLRGASFAAWERARDLPGGV